jgi:transposase
VQQQKESRSMAQTPSRAPNLRPVPELPTESLYVGIDVGKQRHVAGFLSTTLLERHGRFEGCPVLTFAQSREGFRALIDRIRSYVPLEQAYVLLEHTGHYHRALEQYLHDLEVAIYLMPVQKRLSGMLKSDKRDALGLANHLYNQLERGIQLADRTHLVQRRLPPTPAAQQLKGWMRHRYELSQECTRRKNKLTAICDELFPELTEVCHDPNAPMALALRERFPTPHAVATASQAELAAVRTRNKPSNAQLERLQALATTTIGIHDPVRQRALVLEQRQLIGELRLQQAHLQELDEEILRVVTTSREGQILTSIPGIGPTLAAAIVSAIGHIGNFPTAAALKSYFGWAPVTSQSGTSLDVAHLTRGGTRTMKQLLFLAVASAIQQDCEWARLYERLVSTKCAFNERTRTYTGKVKIMARIAGQMIEMIYAFLTSDAELLSRSPAGEVPPPPMCYDPQVHQAHRQGHYHPLKQQQRDHKLLHLSQRSGRSSRSSLARQP